MDDPPQPHDEQAVAEQYFPHPSPVPPTKKRVSLWSYVSSFANDRYNDKDKDDKRRSFNATRESSDTLLPTTYSNTNVIKGGSSNVGNLHQRNINAGGSAIGDGAGMMRRISKGHPQEPHNTVGNHHHNHNPVHNNKTCSSILLGGQYYPGKDKKRRAMRRRTLWYRICCSSPPRKFLSWLVVFYFLGYCFLLPLLGIGGFGGGGRDWADTSYQDTNPVWRILSSFSDGFFSDTGNGSNGASNILETLQYDTSLQLLSLRQEQVALHHIESERSRLQFETKPILDQAAEDDNNNDDDEAAASSNLGSAPSNARQQILERIAPLWFHRNDAAFLKQHKKDKLKRDDSDPAGETPRKNKKHRSKTKPLPKSEKTKQQGVTTPTITSNTTSIPHNQAQKAGGGVEYAISNQRQRILTVSGGSKGPPSRTIHDMQSVATNHSSCNLQQPSDGLATTLVIQTSINRLWILKETCQRWKNPIVVVVFVPSSNAAPLDMVQEVSDDPNCSQLRIVQYMASDKESITRSYPVNRLRNIGLDHVTTSHILVMDVDFVPSQGLDHLIGNAIKVQKDSSDKMALIVPAFERQPPEDCETELDCARYLQQNSSFLPHTFDDLRHCVLEEDCIVFQSDVNVEGHSTTRSHEWINKKWYDGDEGDASSFRTVPCFHTARYEPYVVLEWCPQQKSAKSITPAAPYYDERFYGYGKNKIELISHLRKSGYRFKILPEGFLVHNPHPESSVKETWNDRDDSDLHSSMDALYGRFLKELDTMYADVHNQTIKLCKRS